MISDRELPAAVEATNEANRRAMVLQTRLLAFFQSYVGKKVKKVDGTLLAKIQADLNEYLGDVSPTSSVYTCRSATSSVHICRSRSDYSLDWMVKVSKSYGEGVTYASACAFVGELRNGVLVKLGNPVVLKTDYTVEGVRAARQKAADLKRAYDDARGACYPFGEW